MKDKCALVLLDDIRQVSSELSTAITLTKVTASLVCRDGPVESPGR